MSNMRVSITILHIHEDMWGDEACRTILCQDHNEQNYSNLVPTFVCVGPRGVICNLIG